MALQRIKIYMIDDTFVWLPINLQNLENPTVKFIPYKNVDLLHNTWKGDRSDVVPGNVLIGVDNDVVKVVGVICTKDKISWENCDINLPFRGVEKLGGKTRLEIASLSGIQVDIITTNFDVGDNLLALLVREIDKSTNSFMR